MQWAGIFRARSSCVHVPRVDLEEGAHGCDAPSGQAPSSRVPTRSRFWRSTAFDLRRDVKMQKFKFVAVIAGVACLAATSAGAAEMRLPSSAPVIASGNAVSLPKMAQAPVGERIQLAQRRGGFRRGAVRRGAVRRGGFRGNRVVGRRGGRGRRIGRGVAIGLGALAIGAIAAEAARANSYGGGQCGRWLRACENGSYRSCRRYDRNC
jgi:hypothetical protein